MNKDFSLYDTIKDAQEYLRENWKQGVHCPCCDKWVKLYKVPINKSMTTVLREMYLYDKNHPKAYFHVENELVKLGIKIKGVHGKLKHWGLVEQKTNEDETKRDSGMWRITDRGRLFVERRLKIPKYKYLYNDKVYGQSDTFIQFDGNIANFNYGELMQS